MNSLRLRPLMPTPNRILRKHHRTRCANFHHQRSIKMLDSMTNIVLSCMVGLTQAQNIGVGFSLALDYG